MERMRIEEREVKEREGIKGDEKWNGKRKMPVGDQTERILGVFDRKEKMVGVCGSYSSDSLIT